MRLLLIAPLLAAAGVAAAYPPTGPECPCPPPAGDAVLRFNEAGLVAIRTDRTPPPVAVRRLALVHVAVYDAVNATAPTHEPFRVGFDNPVDADPETAAAVAAHRTLTEFYPAQAEQLDAALAAALAPVPAGPRKSRGIALGQFVAERVLAWRAGDDAAGSRYAPRPVTGRWRPTPPEHRPPLLPGWGGLPCLAVSDPAAFRPPGPPDLTSAEYAAAYRQVRDLGGGESRIRTRDQTEVAFFWADGDGTVTPPGHWNRVAQTVARGRGTTLAENARLFALLNVAMADAGVVCWECKYHFDVWRPVTAAREEDPDWSPLLVTPPFPAYTSGHSSFSGSAAAALAAFFGSDEVRFASTSDGVPGVVRSYPGFWAAAEEAGMSRIYGGIHWSFDNADGLRCGREVGEYVAGHFFRPREAGGRGVTVEFAIRRRGR
jgi:hypothetical protein